jgi:hypothetical protein
MRSETGLFHGLMKARRAIDPIDIQQGHTWLVEVRATTGVVLRNARSSEKTEGRTSVKFYINRH